MNIVDNKTMRGDHMIMIAVLSAASMLMLYYGSLMTPTEVYLPISPSTLRHSKPEVTTTSTLAPPTTTTTTTTTSTPKLRADANICCQAETPICKACHEGISVEEYMRKNTKIMIAIPTFNRRGYTKFNAKVIREYHKIPSNSLYIFDDCSTEYGEKELREWYGKDIHFFPCTKRLKSDANIRRMFEYFLTTDFDLIFSVDTDLIFHKNWHDFILKHIDSTDGVMSLYHSNAPHHKTFNCKGDLCEKKSMGSAGTVMKRSIVKKMLRQHKSHMFDWGFVSIFKKRKIRMMVPKNSLIMHYGQIGQNNGCGSSEVARGFDRTVLPKWINDGLSFYFDKCNNPNKILHEKRTVSCLSQSLPGYRRNTNPVYDTDTSPREDKLYQYNVYNRAITMAERYNRGWIIDIGCGSGKKLHYLYNLGFNVVGIDFGANIKSAQKKFYGIGKKRAILKEYNLNKDMPDIPEEIIKNSILVSADVIEHLVNPDNLIKIFKRFINLGAKGVISTPDNNKLSKKMTPPRRSDVQVWSKHGFEKYIQCHNMEYTLFERLNNKVDKIKNGVGVQFGSDIQPNDYFDGITIIIKTMNRYKKTNIFINSIRKKYNLPIIVVDDGHNVQDNFYNGVKYIKIPFDSGLSKGRNTAVAHVRTEFVLVVDDDFLFTDNVDLLYAKNLLHDVDIVSGSLDGKTYAADLRYIDNTLHICEGIVTKYNDKCYKTRRVLNLFLTRTSFLRLHPWEERRKLQEHTWWFGNLSRTNTRIVYCDNFKLQHQPKVDTSEYKSLRHRYFKFKDDPKIRYCAKHCKTNPSGTLFNNFNSMINILNDLNAPYRLHGGSLLFWYRDCKLPHDDLDIAIEWEWFKTYNGLLKKSLKREGWRMREKFGLIDKTGYEEAWVRNGKKCDLFTIRHINNRYVSGLTINGKVNSCSYTCDGTTTEKWGNLVVKVPFPVEDVLSQYYGKDWRTPNLRKYIWNKTPLEEGRHCSKIKNLYLIQGPAYSYEKWKRIFSSIPQADMLYHSYDKPCSGCIFDNSTNYVTGHNLMLKHALKYSGNIKYITHIDYDVKLDRDWKDYNDYLLQSNEITTAPVDPIRKRISGYQTCVDPAIISHRYDKLHYYYPLSEYRTDISWWHGVLAAWHVAKYCFPNTHLVTSKFKWVNLVHLKYPKAKDITILNEILKKDYGTLNLPLMKKVPEHGCLAGKKIHICESFLLERFKKYFF